MDEKTQAILDAMEKGFATVGSKLEGQMAELSETAKKVLEPKPEDIKTPEQLKTESEAKLAEEARLKQAGVSGITNFVIWDIPIGQGLVGGFTAAFASELIDGVLMKQGDMIKAVVKLAAAGAAVKWGTRLLGSTGAKALAILLAYDGVRSLIPIDTWARRGATTVSGMVPGGGLGGFRPGVTGNPAGNGQGDYYVEKLRGAI